MVTPKFSLDPNYRQDLVKKLTKLHSQWDEWGEIAHVLLAKEQETNEYKNSNRISPEEATKKIEDLLAANKLFDVYKSISIFIDYYLKSWTKFSEKENELVKDVVWNFYKNGMFYGAQWLSLFKKSLPLLSQWVIEELSTIVVKNSYHVINDYHFDRSIIEQRGVLDYHIIDKFHNRPSWVWSNGTEYLFSAKSSLKEIVNAALTTTNNIEFIYSILPILIKNRYFLYDSSSTYYMSNKNNYSRLDYSWIPEKTIEQLKKDLTNPDVFSRIFNQNTIKSHWLSLSEIIVFLKWLDIKLPLSDVVWYSGFEDNYNRNDVTRDTNFFEFPWKREYSSIIDEWELNERMDQLIIDGTIDENVLHDLLIVNHNFQDVFKHKSIKEKLDVNLINNNIDLIAKNEKYRTYDNINGINSFLESIDATNVKLDGKIAEMLWSLWDTDTVKLLLDKTNIDINNLPKTLITAKVYASLYDLWKITEDNIKQFPRKCIFTFSSSGQGYTMYRSYLSPEEWPTKPAEIMYMNHLINNSALEEIMSLFFWEIYLPTALNVEQMNLLVDRVINETKKIKENEFSEFYSRFRILIREMPWYKGIYLQDYIYNKIEDYEYVSKYKDSRYDEMTKKINHSELPKSLAKKLIEKWCDGAIGADTKIVADPYISWLEEFVNIVRSVENKIKEDRQDQLDIQERSRAVKLKLEEASINNVVEWTKGKTIVNYTTRWQKYVLSIKPDDSELYFLSENLTYHSNIHGKYCENGSCLWGGRIAIDDTEKKVHLYWTSEGYWSIDTKFHQAIKTLLLKSYPGYDIVIG